MSQTTVPIRRQSKTGSTSSRAGLNEKGMSNSTCRICSSSVMGLEPLGCGHRFCTKCLNNNWVSGDRPQGVVWCPLCRTCAVSLNTSFDEKEEFFSAEDIQKLRAMEIAAEMTRVESSYKINASIICLQICALVPTLYYISKWLKLVFYGLISLFSPAPAIME